MNAYKQLTITNVHFRAKCLTMIDRLQTGILRKIIVTKCGKPYSVLMRSTEQGSLHKRTCQFGGKTKTRN